MSRVREVWFGKLLEFHTFWLLSYNLEVADQGISVKRHPYLPQKKNRICIIWTKVVFGCLESSCCILLRTGYRTGYIQISVLNGRMTTALRGRRRARAASSTYVARGDIYRAELAVDSIGSHVTSRFSTSSRFRRHRRRRPDSLPLYDGVVLQSCDRDVSMRSGVDRGFFVNATRRRRRIGNNKYDVVSSRRNCARGV